MPIRRRKDAPGEWFHVMNRGVGGRSMFEQEPDITRFLDLVAEAVAEDSIQVHAYTIVTNHFHALVRSMTGELARALRRIQLGYARHFNRSRERDGPLVRNRFHSKLVDSEAYRRTVVGYIDFNAPRAGLVEHPWDYPFGSCRHHMHGTGPAWLTRDWIHDEVIAAFGPDSFAAETYSRLFHDRFTNAHFALVDRRLRDAHDDHLPVDSLLRGLPASALEWIHERARIADGARAGTAIVPAAIVVEVADALGPPPGPERTALLTLLLRQLGGLTFAEISRLTGHSQEWIRRLHHRLTAAGPGDKSFDDLLASIAHESLELTYGPQSQSGIALAPHVRTRTRLLTPK